MSVTSTHQLYGPPKVGGDALAYCTRCKIDLAHVIVSMMKGRPSRVICKTCKSQHNYKLGTASFVRTGVARPRKTVERTVVKLSEHWEKKLEEKKSQQTRPYKPQETFLAGEVIQHPKFGLGIVEEVKRGGKIAVLFRDDELVLIHSFGGA